jgi:hypothetical protein
MSRLGPLLFGVISGFLILFCVATFPSCASAQSQEVVVRSTGKIVRVCKLTDLDSNVLFLSNDSDFIAAFNLQNISETPCVPQPTVGFPMFDPVQSQKTKPFDLCTDCEDRLPNGEYRVHDPVVLNSGETAHLTYQWKTTAPDDAVTCLPLHALFDPVLVVAPTLFKPVCSEIALSRVYPGEFVPPPNDHPRDGARSGEIFVLSSRKARYYQDELFTLHVGLADSNAGPPSDEECPILFLREKSPDGSTRFDEVSPAGFKACKNFTPGANRSADWQSGFEVNAGVRSRWTGIGEHSFVLYQPIGSSRDGTIQFVRSNKLTVSIEDPALISRKWQGRLKGVGVDVSLDKGAYKLGEDVPLHIAVENFNAPVPIYAISPLWDPYQAIGVEVRDMTGRPLTEDERFPMETFWSGHGLAPFPFALGELVPIERSLALQGWLPNRPGTYEVVVSWCPLDGTHAEPGSGLRRNDEFKPYATVQARTIFRIVTEPLPGSHSEP